VPVEELKAQTSCSSVWGMLEGIPSRKIPMVALSAALDHTVKVSKRPGYVLTDTELGAVRALLCVAMGQLPRLNAWSLAAFMCCAAGFKGALQPASLAAWQAALSQPGMVQELNPQQVSNVLLSLGTLADSDPQLTAAVDRPLVEKLLQHAVDVLCGKEDTDPRDVCNALYGAALLGLQPSRGQIQALFGVARRVAQGLHYINLTQLLLACQRLVEQGSELRKQRGLEAPPPSKDPYHLLYPGDDLMDMLLDRALQLARCGMTAREAAQILGACGALGYLPAPAA
jgi:hypothetical protein